MSISIQIPLSSLETETISYLQNNNLVQQHFIEPSLQQGINGQGLIITFIANDGRYFYYWNRENTLIPTATPVLSVGNEGTRYFSTGVGRKSWLGFVVTDVTPNGRRMTVRYDNNGTETLEWRKPGKWIPVGTKGKDYRYYSIVLGERKTGTEEGIF